MYSAGMLLDPLITYQNLKLEFGSPFFVHENSRGESDRVLGAIK